MGCFSYILITSCCDKTQLIWGRKERVERQEREKECVYTCEVGGKAYYFK